MEANFNNAVTSQAQQAKVNGTMVSNVRELRLIGWHRPGMALLATA